MQAIILLGAPGAGKGTISELMTKSTDFIHVSTGDMLRAAVKEDKPVGLEAKSFMEKGALVPDEVIMKIVKERLDSGLREDKYMFDGFPRTMEQAELLDQTLVDLNSTLTHVFLLDVPRDVLIDRLAGRRICRGCGAVYHVRNLPPKVEGVCDKCGGTDIYQRPDDNEETVANRLEVFKKQTESLIAYYDRKGLLIRITKLVREEIEAEVLAKLQP